METASNIQSNDNLCSIEFECGSSNPKTKTLLLYIFCVEKAEGKNHLEDLSIDGRKMDLQEVVWGHGTDW